MVPYTKLYILYIGLSLKIIPVYGLSTCEDFQDEMITPKHFGTSMYRIHNLTFTD